MTNAKVEVIHLMSKGIITWTGRVIKMGYFPPHLVCCINLPLYFPPPDDPNTEKTAEETEARIEKYERQQREYYESIFGEEGNSK